MGSGNEQSAQAEEAILAALKAVAREAGLKVSCTTYQSGFGASPDCNDMQASSLAALCDLPPSLVLTTTPCSHPS